MTPYICVCVLQESVRAKHSDSPQERVVPQHCSAFYHTLCQDCERQLFLKATSQNCRKVHTRLWMMLWALLITAYQSHRDWWIEALTEGDLTDLFSISAPCWPCRQAASFLWVLCVTCLTRSRRFSTWRNTHMHQRCLCIATHTRHTLLLSS